MTLQVVASPRVIVLMTRMAPMIVINLTTLEVSFKLLENIYKTGVSYNHDFFVVQATELTSALYKLTLAKAKAKAKA